MRSCPGDQRVKGTQVCIAIAGCQLQLPCGMWTHTKPVCWGRWPCHTGSAGCRGHCLFVHCHHS